MKLSEPQLELIVFIMFLYCLVIMAGFYSFNKFLYKPLVVKKDQLALENEVLCATRQKLQALKGEDLVLENQRLEQDYQCWGQILPAAANIPEAILFLHQTARETGIELISLSHERAVQTEVSPDDNCAKYIEAVDLVMEVEGSFSSLLDFMAQVENSGRIYSAKHFKRVISSDETAECELIYTTYFQKDLQEDPEQQLQKE